jgi:hypothetical protein
MQLAVENIKKGDVFDRPNGWEAVADALIASDGNVLLDVRYMTDGGLGTREWDDPSMVLEIRRDPAPLNPA